MEYTTPASYGSTLVNVGGLVRDGEIVTAGCSNTAEHTEVKGDAENDWPEPAAVKFTWNGKTKDGKDVHAELESPLGDRLDRVDVMAEVPGFVKKIVGGVAGTRPYIYQVSNRGNEIGTDDLLTRQQYSMPAVLKLGIDGQQTEEKGVFFSEATFIS